jgi:hypothetical protein
MWRPHDIVYAMIAFSGALTIANESVWATGDPVSGKDIAGRWCAQCLPHQTSRRHARFFVIAAGN